MQQHVLDDGIGALAVLHDLVEIVAQRVGQFGDFSAPLFVERSRLRGFLQLVDQFGGNTREIVDEIEWVLDLVRDAGSQLAERGELLRLDQTVLRGPQILQRPRPVRGARFNAFEQPRILDGDRWPGPQRSTPARSACR